MKKAISISICIVMILSMAFAAYAAGNAPDSQGKEKGKNKEAVETTSTEAAPAIIPAETLDGLTKQLKENHKDKEIREVLHTRIKELRKQEGDSTIPVIVNGELVKFDVPPVIKNNRTLIPVRAVSNALGAAVEWDSNNPGIVTITKEVDTSVTEAVYSTVVINLETGEFFKDGVKMELDVPAQVIQNRTFVPIRFLAEAFGMKVDWNKELDGVVVDEEADEEASPSPVPSSASEPSPSPSPNTST